MISKVLIGLAVAVALFLGFVATRPSDYRVTRQALVSAPPAEVFNHVNDFHQWEAWSPWAKLDPAAKNTLEGTSGVGSVFSWEGNNQVGSGRMTIVESRPAEYVGIKLEFIKPFAGVSTSEFTFQPQGNQTLVTWTMSGKNEFIGKLMSLIMNCDKMIGGQFEKGLASLKAVSEKRG